MKKIILKIVVTIFLLAIAIVFGIISLNYYHVNGAVAALCTIISSCAIAINVSYLD